MTNALLQAEGNHRKGKLLIRHGNRQKQYLVSNNLGDTHIRFNSEIRPPFALKGEKKASLDMLKEAFEKQDGKKELAH